MTSAVVLEDEQFTAVWANGAFIPSALACAREQDVEKITQTALSVGNAGLNYPIFIPSA